MNDAGNASSYKVARHLPAPDETPEQPDRSVDSLAATARTAHPNKQHKPHNHNPPPDLPGANKVIYSYRACTPPVIPHSLPAPSPQEQQKPGDQKGAPSHSRSLSFVPLF